MDKSKENWFKRLCDKLNVPPVVGVVVAIILLFAFVGIPSYFIVQYINKGAPGIKTIDDKTSKSQTTKLQEDQASKSQTTKLQEDQASKSQATKLQEDQTPESQTTKPQEDQSSKSQTTKLQEDQVSKSQTTKPQDDQTPKKPTVAFESLAKVFFENKELPTQEVMDHLSELSPLKDEDPIFKKFPRLRGLYASISNIQAIYAAIKLEKFGDKELATWNSIKPLGFTCFDKADELAQKGDQARKLEEQQAEEQRKAQEKLEQERKDTEKKAGEDKKSTDSFESLNKAFFEEKNLPAKEHMDCMSELPTLSEKDPVFKKFPRLEQLKNNMASIVAIYNAIKLKKFVDEDVTTWEQIKHLKFTCFDKAEEFALERIIARDLEKQQIEVKERKAQEQQEQERKDAERKAGEDKKKGEDEAALKKKPEEGASHVVTEAEMLETVKLFSKNFYQIGHIYNNDRTAGIEMKRVAILNEIQTKINASELTALDTKNEDFSLFIQLFANLKACYEKFTNNDKSSDFCQLSLLEEAIDWINDTFFKISSFLIRLNALRPNGTEHLSFEKVYQPGQILHVTDKKVLKGIFGTNWPKAEDLIDGFKPLFELWNDYDQLLTKIKAINGQPNKDTEIRVLLKEYAEMIEKLPAKKLKASVDRVYKLRYLTLDDLYPLNGITEAALPDQLKSFASLLPKLILFVKTQEDPKTAKGPEYFDVFNFLALHSRDDKNIAYYEWYDFKSETFGAFCEGFYNLKSIHDRDCDEDKEERRLSALMEIEADKTFGGVNLTSELKGFYDNDLKELFKTNIHLFIACYKNLCESNDLYFDSQLAIINVIVPWIENRFKKPLIEGFIDQFTKSHIALNDGDKVNFFDWIFSYFVSDTIDLKLKAILNDASKEKLFVDLVKKNRDLLTLIIKLEEMTRFRNLSKSQKENEQSVKTYNEIIPKLFKTPFTPLI
jgi:hypothetical protein